MLRFSAAGGQNAVSTISAAVFTEYGLTHVIASGPEDGTPVFLMPGLFGGESEPS